MFLPKAWVSVSGGCHGRFNAVDNAFLGQRSLAMAVGELRHQGAEGTVSTLR